MVRCKPLLRLAFDVAIWQLTFFCTAGQEEPANQGTLQQVSFVLNQILEQMALLDIILFVVLEKRFSMTSYIFFLAELATFHFEGSTKSNSAYF